ncbi:hypothetical protein GE061_017427 [Apolygus lucorum]|uniref:Uncharacterized protein n=1 Tax=Apolygus lucorum TaxID=248454 RepID=A0A8S9XD46_APOLU|nr:hypothetical protein GE061_017427 [Apolygus lucorum]
MVTLLARPFIRLWKRSGERAGFMWRLRLPRKRPMPPQWPLSFLPNEYFLPAPLASDSRDQKPIQKGEPMVDVVFKNGNDETEVTEEESGEDQEENGQEGNEEQEDNEERRNEEQEDNEERRN